MLKNRFFSQRAALPETLLYAARVEKNDSLDPHGGDRDQHPSQDRGARQGKDEGNGEGGRRIRLQTNFHFQSAFIDVNDSAVAHGAAEAPHSQLIAQSCAVDIQDVPAATPEQANPVVALDPVFLEQQDQVHDPEPNERRSNGISARSAI